MNYKEMLDKFQELDTRLKVLEEDYWLNKLNKLKDIIEVKRTRQ